MKEYESQQIREKQERMNQEDLKVQPMHRQRTQTQTSHIVHAQRDMQPHARHTCTGVCFLSDWLSSSRPWRWRKRSNGICRRRSCKSMPWPCGPRSRGERTRSWPTWEIWNTSETNWSDEMQIISISTHFSEITLCFVTSAGAGGRVWSRAATNQEGEGIGDCQSEESAWKSKRLQGRAGQERTTSWLLP